MAGGGIFNNPNDPNNPFFGTDADPRAPRVQPPMYEPGQAGRPQMDRTASYMQQQQMQMMNPQQLQNYKQYGDPYYGQPQTQPPMYEPGRPIGYPPTNDPNDFNRYVDPYAGTGMAGTAGPGAPPPPSYTGQPQRPQMPQRPQRPMRPTQGLAGLMNRR